MNVNSITLDLFFENGNANSYGLIVGAAGTTSINATLALERRTLFGKRLIFFIFGTIGPFYFAKVKI